ncbi:hypothetical protein Barb7_01783 [Bacteroidales bacterium Barb7]|nr:hypothetical protein Barb7_01783 [Bacteroidales bacterium Barb7]
MAKQFIVGSLIFSSKKEALNHYKNILNAYNTRQTLNDNDFNEVLELLKSHPYSKTKFGIGIESIRIGKIPRYNTKAFELMRFDKTTEIFSYIQCIGISRTDLTKFSKACRMAIQDDLRNVKLSYFQQFSKKGKVKCQETGEYLEWEELVIDHRQPNTFSVIVDRFIELYNIDIQNINYIEVLDGVDEFENEELKQKFREYHKEKANLRIVKKKLNSSRAHQGRISRQSKDLTIE